MSFEFYGYCWCFERLLNMLQKDCDSLPLRLSLDTAMVIHTSTCDFLNYFKTF